jgi:predicted  nucleic acid-binding Zn-ribbon protein
MSPDIRLLLAIQALDDAIAERSAEIDSLPKHIAEIEKKLQSHQARLKADKDALAANQKKYRDLEGEIADARNKISKLKGQMLQAKTNEQYKAFQHEIDFHENAIRTAEDQQLLLMEQAEILAANVASAEAGLKVEQASVNAERAEAEKRVAAARQARDQHQAERKQLVSQLSKDVLRNYENMKSRGRKQVIAEVTGGTCGACHLTVRLQVVQELALTDQLHRCDTCGAYLYVMEVTAVDEHGPSRTAV